MKGGQIIFSICWGKISEGYDFTDDMARAVIVIGIPIANIKEKKMILRKEYYLAKNSLEWFENDAMRAVN